MLSVTATYALRALTELANRPDGTPLLGKDLSRKAGIPPNYLSKILWILGGNGLIEATRGVRGGYRLLRPADQIRLIEIVSLFDKTRTGSTCLLFERRQCSGDKPCSAHEAWSRVSGSYSEFLQSTTIADIAGEEKPGRRGPRSRASSARSGASPPGIR